MLTLLPGDESTTWNDDMAPGRGSLREETEGTTCKVSEVTPGQASDANLLLSPSTLGTEGLYSTQWQIKQMAANRGLNISLSFLKLT